MNSAASLPTKRFYRIGVSTFFFIQGITFASWACRIPDVQAQLDLSEGELGAVLLALPLGQLMAMMLSGFLVNKFGSKAMLIVGALLYPATLVLLGAAQDLWQLVGVLILFGVFGNLSNISVNTQGVGVERIYGRSVMASFHGLWSLAGFVGGILGAVMVKYEITTLSHFTLVFTITLSLLLLTKNFLVPRDARRQKETEKKKAFVKPDAFILTLGLIAFACMICEGTMFDWTGVYFEKVVKPSKDLTRLGYIAFMSTMAGGRFVSDYFVTRFGIKLILQASGIIIFSGMLMAVLLPSLVWATLGFLLVGIGTSSVVPLVISLAGKSSKIAPSIALAMVSSIGFLGFLLGPPLIGFLAEATNLRISFALIAVLGLGTTVLAKRIGGMRA